MVPPAHVPRILSWFKPAKYTRDAAHIPNLSRDVLGQLEIATKQGDRVAIQFYWTGVNPVLFPENGVDYFLGRVAYDEETHHGFDGGIEAANAVKKAFMESVVGKKE
jgi:hypothetical protein